MDQHTDSRGEHRSVDDDAVPAVEATVTCTCPLYMYAVSSFTCPAHGLIRFGKPTVEAEMSSLYVRFDGPPSQETGRFVEVETEDGLYVSPETSGAYWSEQEDGTWLLGPFPAPTVPAPETVEAAPSTDEREELAWGEFWDAQEDVHLNPDSDDHSERAEDATIKLRAAIRAPLEESRQRLTDAFCEVWLEEVARRRAAEERIRELEVERDEIYLQGFRDGGHEPGEAVEEYHRQNAKLREALRGSLSYSMGIPDEKWTEWLALATSSTEATKEGDAG